MLGAFAAWNGWNFWQQRQAVQAAALYDQMEAATQAGDVERTTRVLADMQASYPGAEYAAQAALLAAKTLVEKEKTAEAKAALAWVAEKAADSGLQATARLRLASLLYADKAYDEALQQLSARFDPAFAPLAARLGLARRVQYRHEAVNAKAQGAYNPWALFIYSTI